MEHVFFFLYLSGSRAQKHNRHKKLQLLSMTNISSSEARLTKTFRRRRSRKTKRASQGKVSAEGKVLAEGRVKSKQGENLTRHPLAPKNTSGSQTVGIENISKDILNDIEYSKTNDPDPETATQTNTLNPSTYDTTSRFTPAPIPPNAWASNVLIKETRKNLKSNGASKNTNGIDRMHDRPHNNAQNHRINGSSFSEGCHDRSNVPTNSRNNVSFPHFSLIGSKSAPLENLRPSQNFFQSQAVSNSQAGTDIPIDEEDEFTYSKNHIWYPPACYQFMKPPQYCVEGQESGIQPYFNPFSPDALSLIFSPTYSKPPPPYPDTLCTNMYMQSDPNTTNNNDSWPAVPSGTPCPPPLLTAFSPSGAIQSPPITDPSQCQNRLALIKAQLKYYFSTLNLCKDTYLRGLFNEENGALAIKELMKFQRIRNLTRNGKDEGLVILALKSPEFELEFVDDDHVRLRSWRKWVMAKTKLTMNKEDERIERRQSQSL